MMLSIKKHCKIKFFPPPTGALRLEHHVVQQKLNVKPVSYYTPLHRTTFVMVKQGGRLDLFNQQFTVLCTAFVYMFIRSKQLGSVRRLLDSNPVLDYGDTAAPNDLCLVTDSQSRYVDNVCWRRKERGGQ